MRVIDNDWIDLPDGVRLAIRIWRPEDADIRPVSAILDSVPEITEVVDVTDHAGGTNPYYEAAKK